MATPFTTYKLIILYMLNNAETSLTNSQISEFILDREYTNYFHLQQAISELEESDLVKRQTRSNTSYYMLTEDGKNTLMYFEKELSSDIKEDVRHYLRRTGKELQKQLLTPADYYVTNQGTHAVRCQIVERKVALLEINIIAPNKDAAEAICRQWPEKSQKIYSKIMEELL